MYVVHIKTSMPTTEKTGMLYMLKLVCLLQKNGKKGYVVHIKTSMFTTEIRKNGMLYILKLVCLLQTGKKRVCCTH